MEIAWQLQNEHKIYLLGHCPDAFLGGIGAASAGESRPDGRRIRHPQASLPACRQSFIVVPGHSPRRLTSFCLRLLALYSAWIISSLTEICRRKPASPISTGLCPSRSVDALSGPLYVRHTSAGLSGCRSRTLPLAQIPGSRRSIGGYSAPVVRRDWVLRGRKNHVGASHGRENCTCAIYIGAFQYCDQLSFFTPPGKTIFQKLRVRSGRPPYIV
jgi:hypothetical protein